MQRWTDEQGAPPRILPGLDGENRPYWTGGKNGKLLIARCTACGTYRHPPFPSCAACGCAHMVPSPVGGRGRVKTFTINRQQWLPSLPVPFVFAAIELDEQPGLYVLSNVIGCPVEAVDFNMAVQVCFLQQEDVFLPMFIPAAGAGT
jgi:uncharacterized protein